MSPLRAASLVFGRDGDVFPVRYLWALLYNAALADGGGLAAVRGRAERPGRRRLMGVSGFWGYTSGQATLPLDSWSYAASSTPCSGVAPSTLNSPHAPRQRLTCAQADRAADEQIAGLVEALGEPCPHCGKVRDVD